MRIYLKKLIIFFINFIIYILTLFIKKKENFLLFSSGYTFSGNPKYLYLYLSNDLNLKCYWITSNKEIISYLRSNNLKVAHRWSLKGIYLTIISKYFFLSSGINNICEYFVSKKTKVINLWHGTPIKKIFNDEKKNDEKSIKNLNKFLEGFNCFNTGSKNLIKLFEKSLNRKDIKIYSLGMPSNDILYKSKKDIKFSEEISIKIKKQFSIPLNKKIILYCPTHRDNINDYDLNTLNKFLDKVLLFAKKNGFVLINKFHLLRPPKINPRISNDKDFIDVTYYPDIQEFLIASNLLITDYSSVVFDFSILEKPYILFHYDIKKYSIKRDFYYNWDMFPTKIAYEIDDLIKYLENKNFFDNEKNKSFLSYFNDKDLSCMRIYKEILLGKSIDKNLYKKKFDFLVKQKIFKTIP